MKNKLVWFGLGMLVFFSAGFFFSPSDYFVLLIFAPGLIATVVSQTFFETEGAESLFVVPEVWIVTFLFWLILPWILFVLSNKTKEENREIICGCALGASLLSIGFALNPNFSRFLFGINSILNLNYLIGVVLLIFSAIILIWKIYEAIK